VCCTLITRTWRHQGLSENQHIRLGSATRWTPVMSFDSQLPVSLWSIALAIDPNTQLQRLWQRWLCEDWPQEKATSRPARNQAACVRLSCDCRELGSHQRIPPRALHRADTCSHTVQMYRRGRDSPKMLLLCMTFKPSLRPDLQPNGFLPRSASCYLHSLLTGNTVPPTSLAAT